MGNYRLSIIDCGCYRLEKVPYTMTETFNAVFPLADGAFPGVWLERLLLLEKVYRAF